MSDKIKVLKINKSKKDTFEETTEDFSSEGFWFEEHLDESVSMDFDKTIAVKDKKTSKLDIVQNANSHFFEPKNKELNIKKEDFENKTFESINIVDKMIRPSNSEIRKEIIDMRTMSYQNEQNDKDFLLNKLNVDLNKHNNFKNYNLIKNEEEMNTPLNVQINKIEEQITQLQENLLNISNISLGNKNSQTESNNVSDELEEIKSEEISKEKPEKVKEVKFMLVDHSVVEKKEDEKNVMVEFDNIEHKQNNEKSLDSNKSKKRTLFDDMDTKELKSFFDDESSNYSIPVFNNNDYTVANTVDDLDKAINNLEFGSKKIREKEKFFDQDGGTTQLVESLQIVSKNNKKQSLNSMNFDSFEEWFNNSKDVKKLAKLAKKENKKMNKNMKK
ncbi:hypothetical protein [Spiroplasma monobiae]|uniref:Uncharacterized protein n=1 Tax=Spiroplasma monobiae MQ-1 TaxID=1336748 RepID=A0A2K9LU43_SPISQ|nr:hypothetical protein [Spiroplasma monobiae]AUM62540.1 hypothetical protein SMONO_v1c02910 [Spiroplasma monobiae MQ-1]